MTFALSRVALAAVLALALMGAIAHGEHLARV